MAGAVARLDCSHAHAAALSSHDHVSPEAEWDAHLALQDKVATNCKASCSAGQVSDVLSSVCNPLRAAVQKPLPFCRISAHNALSMQFHASCAAREGHGVLLLGPSGSGKSDLLLRLLGIGFSLVADDRVELAGGVASAPPALAGLLEVRGLGIVRLPHVASVPVALAVELGAGERLPQPELHAGSGRPLVHIDPASASAPQRVALALDCALGRTRQIAGAFA